MDGRPHGKRLKSLVNLLTPVQWREAARKTDTPSLSPPPPANHLPSSNIKGNLHSYEKLEVELFEIIPEFQIFQDKE